MAGGGGSPSTVASGGMAGDSAIEVGFSLAVEDELMTLVQGSSIDVPIVVTRATEQGPITVNASGLPEGVTSGEVVVAAGSNEGTVTLTATALAPQVNPATVSIRAVGSSGSADATVELVVRGPSGALDTTFGTDGFRNIDVAFQDYPRATAGPDGVIVAGRVEDTGLIAGLTRSASLDTEFGTDGVLSVEQWGAYGRSEVPRLDPAGRWVVRVTGMGTNWMLRLTADGVLDASFADGGLLRLDTSQGNSGGILPLSNGEYLVGNSISTSGFSAQYTRRIGEDGEAEGSDDGSRVVYAGLSAVAGQSPRAFIRYTDEEKPHPNAFCSFTDGGGSSCWNLPSGLTSYGVVRMEPARGNRIAVAWSSKVGQFAGTSLDHEFAEAGLLEVEVPNATSPTLRGLATMEVNFRGEIYIIGDAAFGTNRKTFVAKIDEKGKYVSDFGTDGFVVIDYEPLDKEVGFDLWLDGDGIYLLFLSLDAGESAALRGKLHAARIWR